MSLLSPKAIYIGIVCEYHVLVAYWGFRINVSSWNVVVDDDAVCDIITPFPAMKETLVWEGV